ncbi:hypothetical protein ERJ77_25010, partial [Vibrio anguillarum]|nr:hypothetical protein [Vibrio anguillarum]
MANSQSERLEAKAQFIQAKIDTITQNLETLGANPYQLQREYSPSGQYVQSTINAYSTQSALS